MYFKAGKYQLPLGQRAHIMAIINLTPDSFYEDSRFDAERAVSAAILAQKQGAAIIDLGAQSTAPGNAPISADDELARLEQPLTEIRKAVDIPISVDTFYKEVADFALKNKADIINDVSGQASTAMAELAASYEAGWICMHTGGYNSAQTPAYQTDIIDEIKLFFNRAIKAAGENRVALAQLCLDPGIGFGKTRANDLEIISRFDELCGYGCATLAGLSRKRVTALCGDSLTGTIASNAACISGGASIIRVHDVSQGLATAEMINLITTKHNGGNQIGQNNS